MTEDADAGVHQEADGSWTWWARWLGGTEQSGHTYSSREDATRALLDVLRDSTNP